MSTALWLELFGWATKAVTCFSVLISTPIYISILVFIQRQAHKAPFNSPFYSCFTALGIVDLCCYWLYMLKKFQYWDWRLDFLMPPDQPNFACSFFYFLIWMTGMAQWQLNILISLNRFISLMFPELYKKYWTIRLNRFYISAVFLFCTAATLRILWLPTFIQTTIIVDDTQNFTKFTGPVFMEDSTKAFYSTIWKVHIYILLGICVFCYIPMFLKIRRLDLSDRNTKTQWEVKMLYTLISLLVVNVLYIVFLIVRDYLNGRNKEFGRFSEWSLYLLADIYDLHNPYNMLITCKRVRWGSLPYLLLRPKHNQTTPVPQMVGQQQQQQQQLAQFGLPGHGPIIDPNHLSLRPLEVQQQIAAFSRQKLSPSITRSLHSS